MNDILNIPSKNSYLTSKQWEEIIQYVKNKKNVTEDSPVVENPEIIESPTEVIYSEAYEQMILATSVGEMYMILLIIMNENPDKLYEITTDEIQTLYNTANQMNKEKPSEDYQDLIDTLQYLAGEYDLNGAITYATWNGTSASGTYTISGTITMSSAINIASGNTLTLTGSGVIKRGSGSAYLTYKMVRLLLLKEQIIIIKSLLMVIT